MGTYDVLRVIGAGACVAGLAGGLYVASWYARSGILSAARLVHVLSVFLGWTLAETAMAFELVHAIGEPWTFWRTPLCLGANALVGFGVLALWQRARAIKHDRER